MLYDGKIWIGTTDDGERAMLLPKMANRHGLIAGATGTGKTITLKVMAESFSDLGVPVFFADVKGDLAATMFEGKDSEDMQRRIEKFGLEEAGWDYDSYPTTLYDLFGKNGIPLRTTISEMGAPLLSRILDLNNLQTDLMSVAFKIADDQDLLLVDTKDLKALLNYMGDNNKEFAAEYGNIAKNSIGAMLRAIVALESEGGDQFFGEPGINIHDWFTTSRDGKGMISILDSQTLINNGRLYSTFLLWMLSELFETLPEVGDLDKPKMVFFFDEAHLLFSGTSKALLDKIEQVVKLVRSKGVGVYFVTQNPRDVPDNVLAQLNTKIEHGLRAYTPAEQRAVKAAAQAFRENPAFNTYETILALGTGEAVISYLGADGIPTVAQKVNILAVISYLGADGIPTVAQKVNILPPQSRMGSITDSERENAIKSSVLYTKYKDPVDPDSAFEFLERRGVEMAEAAAVAAAKAAEEKEAAKAAAAAEREAQKAKEREEAARRRAAQSVGNTVAGTVGREVGKTFGGKFGKFGQTIGGNIGASLGRGVMGTLFNKIKK